MINLPSPEEFLQWQISHYTQRLAEAKTIEARSFLRQQLYNLKKKKDESD